MRRAKLDDARHGRYTVQTLSAFNEIDQHLLHVETMAVPKVCKPPSFTETEVYAVRHQHPRFQSIGKIGCNDFGENLVAKHGIAQTEDHLDALVDIPLHPVSAAEIQFGLAG